MFKRSIQLNARRFGSHGPDYGVSKHINDVAFKKVNVQAGEAYVKKYTETVHHSEGVTNLWKKLTYFIAIPGILLTAIPVVKVELAHAEHRKHLAHLSDEEWPQQYDYQNIRSKAFFWGNGDETLFWNRDINRNIQPE